MRRMIEAHELWMDCIDAKSYMENISKFDGLPVELKVEAIRLADTIDKFGDKMKELYREENKKVKERIKNGDIVI